MPLDYGVQYREDVQGCPHGRCYHGSAVHRAVRPLGKIVCWVPGCVCGRDL